MDISYLAQQVNTIVGQLHGLFDEIGVAHNDREHREAEVSKNKQRRQLRTRHGEHRLIHSHKSFLQLSPRHCRIRCAE